MWKSELLWEQLYRATPRHEQAIVEVVPLSLNPADPRPSQLVDRIVGINARPENISNCAELPQIMGLMNDDMITELLDILSNVDKMNKLCGRFINSFAQDCTYRGMRRTPENEKILHDFLDEMIRLNPSRDSNRARTASDFDFGSDPETMMSTQSTSQAVAIGLGACVACWFAYKTMKNIDAPRARSATIAGIYAYVMHALQQRIPTDNGIVLITCNAIMTYICIGVYHKLFQGGRLAA